jgi:hypothetical protein
MRGCLSLTFAERGAHCPMTWFDGMLNLRGYPLSARPLCSAETDASLR